MTRVESRSERKSARLNWTDGRKQGSASADAIDFCARDVSRALDFLIDRRLAPGHFFCLQAGDSLGAFEALSRFSPAFARLSLGSPSALPRLSRGSPPAFRALFGGWPGITIDNTRPSRYKGRELYARRVQSPNSCP